MKLLVSMAVLLAAVAAPVHAQDASAPETTKPFPRTVTYECAGNARVVVTYPDPDSPRPGPVKLLWKGRTSRLTEAMSASGARYVSRTLVWWSKGDSGFLTTRGGRMLARDCQETQ